MKPEEALQILYAASERALMRGQDHESVRKALNVLHEKITPKSKKVTKEETEETNK